MNRINYMVPSRSICSCRVQNTKKKAYTRLVATQNDAKNSSQLTSGERIQLKQMGQIHVCCSCGSRSRWRSCQPLHPLKQVERPFFRILFDFLDNLHKIHSSSIPFAINAIASITNTINTVEIFIIIFTYLISLFLKSSTRALVHTCTHVSHE